MKIGIYDASTNTQTERDMTNEEIQRFQKDAIDYENFINELVEKKTAAEAKLALLGLTEDDLKALGLGGN